MPARKHLFLSHFQKEGAGTAHALFHALRQVGAPAWLDMFEDDITEQDHVEEWPEGFKVVIDPKSMLYLFGLELGYSNELIGGGFQFKNPNAETSCGCGTSFGI